MSLSRRNSRPITHDGLNFRWAISNRQECALLLIVQPPDNGQRICIEIPHRDYWSDFKELTHGELEFVDALYRPITPALVKRCMQAALLHGWKPATSSTQLDFHIQFLLPDLEQECQ